MKPITTLTNLNFEMKLKLTKSAEPQKKSEKRRQKNYSVISERHIKEEMEIRNLSYPELESFR